MLGSRPDFRFSGLKAMKDLEGPRDWRGEGFSPAGAEKTNQILKKQFPQKARRAGPSFCITHKSLTVLCAVGTHSPLAKAEEEEEGVISASRIVKPCQMPTLLTLLSLHTHQKDGWAGHSQLLPRDLFLTRSNLDIWRRM